jgi:hypothetical protein
MYTIHNDGRTDTAPKVRNPPDKFRRAADASRRLSDASRRLSDVFRRLSDQEVRLGTGFDVARHRIPDTNNVQTAHH